MDRVGRHRRRRLSRLQKIRMILIAWSLLALGVWFVYCAVKGKQPLSGLATIIKGA